MTINKYSLLSISSVQSYIENSKKLKEMRASSEIVSKTVEFIGNRLVQIGGRKVFPLSSESCISNLNTTNIAIYDCTGVDMDSFTDSINDIDLVNVLDTDYTNSKVKVGFSKQGHNIKIKDLFKVHIVTHEGTYMESSIKLFEKLRKDKLTLKFKDINCKKHSYYESTNVVKICSNCKAEHVEINLLSPNEKDAKTYKCYKCSIKENYIENKENKEQIPSVVDISAMNSLKFIMGNQEAFSEYKKLKNLNINNIPLIRFLHYEQVLKDIDDAFDKKNIDDLKKIEQIVKSLRKKCYITKYYACIRVDADDMGKKMSYEYYKKHTKEKDITDESFIKYQRSISGLLSKIDEKFSKLLDESEVMGLNTIYPIYRGGDDYMIFTCIDNVPNILSIFSDLKSNLVGHYDDRLTFSISVTYAHYNQDLSEVIKICNKNLEKVKSKYHRVYGNTKDATVVSFNNGSGKYYNTDFRNLDMELFIKLLDYSNSGISRKLVYDMACLIRKTYSDMYIDEVSTYISFLTKEAKRLYGRKKVNDQNVNDLELDKLIHSILVNNVDLSGANSKINFENVINMLMVANQISSESKTELIIAGGE